MPIKLAPIEEKDGHRILRQQREEFLPWCDKCKRVVWDYWLENEQEARRYLMSHLVATHGYLVENLIAGS